MFTQNVANCHKLIDVIAFWVNTISYTYCLPGLLVFHTTAGNHPHRSCHTHYPSWTSSNLIHRQCLIFSIPSLSPLIDLFFTLLPLSVSAIFVVLAHLMLSILIPCPSHCSLMHFIYSVMSFMNFGSLYSWIFYGRVGANKT